MKIGKAVPILLNDPTISVSLNHEWPLDQIVKWFLSSPTRSITHFITDIQNTIERVEEKNKENKTNSDLG